jgi:Fe-S cluster assembly scaffold protein SufB
MTINAKPQLNFADVECSHGCTIGQTESAMFYMQQRGIGKKRLKPY